MKTQHPPTREAASVISFFHGLMATTCTCTEQGIKVNNNPKACCRQEGIVIEPQKDGTIYIEVDCDALTRIRNQMSSKSISQGVGIDYFRALMSDPDEHVFMKKKVEGILVHYRTISSKTLAEVLVLAFKRHTGFTLEMSSRKAKKVVADLAKIAEVA